MNESSIQPLVSIIMPCHNSEKTIEEAIISVISQTFNNWELIIVDDGSNDSSIDIIKSYSQKDKRIKPFYLGINSGSPYKPTNQGITQAQGRFIAFLDSDDYWFPTKLEDQVPLFEDPQVAIVFSNYIKVSSIYSKSKEHRPISSPCIVSYHRLLKGNVIGNLTGVYDTKKVGKVYAKDIGHQDYLMWLDILRKGFIAKNTGQIHAAYRLSSSSVSANKLKALSWTWNIFRNHEHLSLLQSLYYFSFYAFGATIKHFK